MPRRTSPLKVEPKGDMKELKELLKKSHVVILVIFANWCGHCQTMKKNIWDPMCKRKNVSPEHVAAVESSNLEGEEGKDIMSKVEGFPTVLKVVNGRPVESLPLPKTVEEMENVVNQAKQESVATPNSVVAQSVAAEQNLSAMEQMSPYETAGKSYVPEEKEKEKEQKIPMQGGALYDTMRHISSGILPAGLLGFASLAMRGGRRRQKTVKKARRSKRKGTRKH